MGYEVAVRSSAGALALDARREGSAEAKGYTFPALVASDRMIRDNPKAARAAINAVISAQHALQNDPERASAVGRKRFPLVEAELIAKLIRRDAPFYRPEISHQSVESMNRFARDLGLLSKTVTYEDVVWTG